MPRLIYIATRYADAEHVHTVIRPAIEAAGLGVVSTWHAPPWAPEDLSSLDGVDLARVYSRNRAELAAADVALVIDAPGARETYAEAEQAFRDGVPVVWMGRPHLSALARSTVGGCRVVATLAEAIDAMGVA